MPKRKKKKTGSKKTKSVKIPGSVRRAKNIIKKHVARLQKEKKKQESALSKTSRELRELKNI